MKKEGLMNLNDDGCLNLAEATIVYCSKKPRTKDKAKIREIIKNRIKFIRTSPFIEVLCICSNYDIKRFKKEIIKKNIGFL